MVTGCFIKAGDKVRAARSGRARAYAEATGQLCLPRSGERCSLLMTDADPLYRAAANCVAERVEGITDQPEGLLNPDLLEHVDQDVCYHLSLLSPPVTVAVLPASRKLVDPPKISARSSAGQEGDRECQ